MKTRNPRQSEAGEHSLRPTVTKRKDLRGRIVGYSASIGPIELGGCCDTPKGASRDVETLALRALERLAEGPIFGVALGHAYAVAPSIYGWQYWCDLFSSCYSTESGHSRAETEREVIRHIAACVWTHETDDPSFLASIPKLTDADRKDLASRFAWYRDMRALTAEGYADNDARQILAGFL